MKKILSFFVITAILSCNPKENKTNATENSGTNIENQGTPLLGNEHSAETSLDYAGTYEGIVPCADCEGINLILVLDYEKNFTLVTTYVDKEKIPATEEKGKFSFNKEGNIITLEGTEEIEGPNKFFVGENQLFVLDGEGNRITGELADKYILRKAGE